MRTHRHRHHLQFLHHRRQPRASSEELLPLLLLQQLREQKDGNRHVRSHGKPEQRNSQHESACGRLQRSDQLVERCYGSQTTVMSTSDCAV